MASGVWRLASGVWRLASKANWINADKGFITCRIMGKKRAWSELESAGIGLVSFEYRNIARANIGWFWQIKKYYCSFFVVCR